MADDEKEVARKNIDISDQNPTVAVISILGQQAKFPINQSMVIIIFVMMLGFVAIEAISGGVSKTLNAVITANYSSVSANAPDDGKTITARAYMFWTPAKDTWKDMIHSCHADKKCLEDIKQWKSINFTTHDILEQFGNALKTEVGLKGYSRYPVIGASVYSGDKSGWWWRIIVEDDELNKKEFSKVYKKYFKRESVKLEESIIGG